MHELLNVLNEYWSTFFLVLTYNQERLLLKLYLISNETKQNECCQVAFHICVRGLDYPELVLSAWYSKKMILFPGETILTVDALKTVKCPCCWCAEYYRPGTNIERELMHWRSNHRLIQSALALRTSYYWLSGIVWPTIRFSKIPGSCSQLTVN